VLGAVTVVVQAGAGVDDNVGACSNAGLQNGSRHDRRPFLQFSIATDDGRRMHHSGEGQTLPSAVPVQTLAPSQLRKPLCSIDRHLVDGQCRVQLAVIADHRHAEHLLPSSDGRLDDGAHAFSSSFRRSDQ
jgi:hypothetical protein